MQLIIIYNLNRLDFYLVIETALRKHSPKCVEVLDEAFSDVYEQLKDPANYQKLEQQFKYVYNITKTDR